MMFSFLKMAEDGWYALKTKHENEQFVNAEFDDAEKPKVRALVIHHGAHRLSDLGMRNISNGLVNLEYLVIRDTWNVTDEGYDHFFANTKHLRTINVGERLFRDATFASMAAHCRNLQEVTINHSNDLTQRALDAFVDSGTPLVNLTLIDCDYILYDAIESFVAKCKTLKVLFYTGHLPLSTIQCIATSSSVKYLFAYKSDAMEIDANTAAISDLVPHTESTLHTTWLNDDIVREAIVNAAELCIE